MWRSERAEHQQRDEMPRIGHLNMIPLRNIKSDNRTSQPHKNETEKTIPFFSKASSKAPITSRSPVHDVGLTSAIVIEHRRSGSNGTCND